MMRSAKALVAPGRVPITASIRRAIFSISARSVPKTLTPTGVRMPVASMSMRALIGMVQALETPGNCSALSISAISLSTVMPGRHSVSGLRLITVSNISVGAGSVAVVARPALPHTDSTSGNIFMILFWVCTSSAALVTERPRQGGRHVHERALVEAGHELAAEARGRPQACGEHRERQQDGGGAVAQRNPD